MDSAQSVSASASEMRSLLSGLGLSQAEFARRIGSSVQCVNAWCAGRTGRVPDRPALAYRVAILLLKEWEAEERAKNFALNETLRSGVPELEKFPEYKP